MTLHDIKGENLTSGGALLTGAEVNKNGYLRSVALGANSETDLMTFSLDGFHFRGARGYGVKVSGPAQIRNGTIVGSHNGIVLTDECTRFDIDNVTVLDSESIGIRADFGGALWSPARKKVGTIRNSFIAGSKGAAAITMNNSSSVVIENNRLGYRKGRDSGDEKTQLQGVSVMPAGAGVVARGNDVTTSKGAVAYSALGSGDRENAVEDPKGVKTTSGSWPRAKKGKFLDRIKDLQN